MPTQISLGSEPVAIITAADIGLQAVQAVLPISSTAHAVIAIILVGLGGILARAVVSPTAKPSAA